MCFVTLPRWDSPNTLVRSCQISSELTYQLDVQLKLGFLVILYLLGRLVVGNICYKWANALVPPTPSLRPWLSDVIRDVSIFVICPKVIF
jgi:hypothetical protein